METCLIKIKVGNKIKYGNRTVEVINFYLAPNGMKDPSLVAVIVAKDAQGTVSATSDKFAVIDDVKYEKYFPSDALIDLQK